MRILSIEDDAATRQGIELMLKAEGFAVQGTDLGEEGLGWLRFGGYDLVLLDLNLPDMPGLGVLKKMRAEKIDVPVIVVSGTQDFDQRVLALNIGADDFIQKPFHKEDLVARIRAVARRSAGHAHSVVEVGSLAVDLDRKTVSVGGREVHVTGREFQMMEILAMRKGQTLTKETLMIHLYQGRDEAEPKIVDVFVCKLRKRLRAAGWDGKIETVWGRGYVLRDQAPVVADA